MERGKALSQTHREGEVKDGFGIQTRQQRDGQTIKTLLDIQLFDHKLSPLMQWTRRLIEIKRNKK